jgi:hypothetical protein
MKAKRIPRTPRPPRLHEKETDVAQRKIKRIWGDVLVRDAKHDLRVFIEPSDIKSAIPLDPQCCVFARACKRTFRATRVLFYRSRAYVELPDEMGARHVERFLMTPPMRQLIVDFDAGKEIIPEGGFLLTAPTPGRTLDRQVKRARRYADRERLRVSLKGKQTAPQKRKYCKRHFNSAIEATLRNGTGQVPFAARGGGRIR